MLLNFIATTWLLAMLPGVGQALMLRQALTDGPRIAVATILGTVTGLVIWSAAAGAGLSAALLADPAIYQALLLAGGAVLTSIGLRTLWADARGPGDNRAPHSRDPKPASRRTAYLAGLATNLGNPKAGVFAISLLPAFAGRWIPPHPRSGRRMGSSDCQLVPALRRARRPRPHLQHSTERPASTGRSQWSRPGGSRRQRRPRSVIRRTGPPAHRHYAGDLSRGSCSLAVAALGAGDGDVEELRDLDPGEVLVAGVVDVSRVSRTPDSVSNSDVPQ